MTTTEIRAEIRQRNALRKAALLPLLDKQREFDHACAVIREQRYRAFRETKRTDCERIRQEVFAEQGMTLRTETWRAFPIARHDNTP